ncbi:MAG: hypothetical protein WDZ66_08615 [Steroidobacteraceae bacterium]
MTDISLEDHELIGRYLAKRLTDAEELMVETRIVEDPDFRSEVELTAMLRDGLRQLESRGEVTPLLTRHTEWWNRPRRAVAASMAAIALGLISFLFYQQQERSAPASVSETLRFEQTRGSDPQADVVWERTGAPAQLEMRFDVGPEPTPRYRVTVRRVIDGAAGPAIDRVIPTSSDGDVVLVLDGALLEPGDYEIRLESQPAIELDSSVTYTLTVTG